MEPTKEVRINIPVKTILSIVLTLFGVWIVYQIRDIVILFLIVVAVVVAFSPIIQSWERYIPRTMAIIVLYTLLALGIIIITALILPVFIRQLIGFISYIQAALMGSGYTGDDFLERIRESLNLIVSQGNGTQALAQLLNQFRGSLGAVYSTTLGFLGGIVAVFTVLISSFYLLMEEKNLQGFLATVIPESKQKKVDIIMGRISRKMGNYLLGQLLLMFIVGIVIGIVLAILGVPYAFLLGLWAGLMELLPYIGPVLGAIPGVFLAFATLGVVKGFVAILIYFLVQQLENQFLVPKIMGRALGLSPVIIIFALLVGGKLLGLVGLLIAVPLAAAISVIIEEWHKEGKG